MRRHMLIAGSAALAFATLTACGSSNSARPDISLDGDTDKSVAFTLTMHTEAPRKASADFSVTIDRHKDKSVPLGQADCFDPSSSIIPVTFTAHYKNPAAMDNVELGVEGLMDVKDPSGKILTSISSTNVSLAWLSSAKPNCSSTQASNFGRFSLSDNESIHGVIILPGGADKFDGYQLTLTTNNSGSPVYNIKHAKPYLNNGVITNLIP